MEGYFQQDRKQHANPDGTTVKVPPDLKIGRNVHIGQGVATIGYGVTVQRNSRVLSGRTIEAGVNNLPDEL